MPEISRFYGIVIQMYFDDHEPPHFHARYGSESAKFSISPLGIIAGRLSPRALSLVMEWAAAHLDELREDWRLRGLGLPLNRIDPLR